MAGLSLEDLPWPRKVNRVDLIPGSKFETEEASQQEDRARARSLRNQAEGTTSNKTAYSRVAERIDNVDEPDWPRTIASAVVMRLLRIIIAGALLCLCRDHAVHFVTLIPRGFSVTPDELITVDAVAKNAWLRSTLASYGANSGADGWIFAYLDGDYNPETGMIQLHWHAIVVGDDMLQVIDTLRRHSRFKRTVGACNNPDGVDQRILVQHPDLPAFPAVISYAIKGAWYAKLQAYDKDGNRKTQPKRRRIPEPVGSQVLLWLDQWRVGDMAMMINLRVGKSGLIAR